MTTFHSDTVVRRSEIECLWADSNEPDAIGFEASHRGRQLFSIYFEESGSRSIRFSLPPDIEFDATEFRDLIKQATARLEEWDTELRADGGAWSDEAMARKK
jgi:hypothetical protein